MSYKQIFPFPGDKIKRIIMHDNETMTYRFCLTLDFHDTNKLSYALRDVFQTNLSWKNINEVTHSADHDLLHRAMAIAMGLSIASTLTDYHQHWLLSETENGITSMRRFTIAEAMELLVALISKKYIKPDHIRVLMP